MSNLINDVKLTSLSVAKQIFICSQFRVNDIDNTFVNKYGQPFTIVDGFRSVCTAINTVSSYNSKN